MRQNGKIKDHQKKLLFSIQFHFHAFADTIQVTFHSMCAIQAFQTILYA